MDQSISIATAPGEEIAEIVMQFSPIVVNYSVPSAIMALCAMAIILSKEDVSSDELKDSVLKVTEYIANLVTIPAGAVTLN